MGAASISFLGLSSVIEIVEHIPGELCFEFYGLCFRVFWILGIGYRVLIWGGGGLGIGFWVQQPLHIDKWETHPTPSTHHQEKTHHEFHCVNKCKTYRSWLLTCLSTTKSVAKITRRMLCSNVAEEKNEFRMLGKI